MPSNSAFRRTERIARRAIRTQDGPRSGFFKPHFSILEIKVVGFTPKSSAAPSGPLIFQLAASNASKRLSRSKRSSSASVRNLGCAKMPADESGSRTRSSRRRRLAGDGQVKIQSPAAGQNHAALNHVAQFPHIARPIVILELCHRRPGQPGFGALQVPWLRARQNVSPATGCHPFGP